MLNAAFDFTNIAQTVNSTTLLIPDVQAAVVDGLEETHLALAYLMVMMRKMPEYLLHPSLSFLAVFLDQT